MRARWSEIYKRANYEFFYANCATTVADILRAGGADLSARVRWHMDQVTVWVPWQVFMIAQVILTYSATIERLRAQGWKREELDSTTAWSELASVLGQKFCNMTSRLRVDRTACLFTWVD